MKNFEFDTSRLVAHLNRKETLVNHAAKQTMHDAVDDLARISSNITPIKKSTLRKSHNKEVEAERNQVVGEVSFSVVEADGLGGFNYALWIHEMDYNLGPQSAESPGTDGYHVGNKYLERPLKGEAQKYIEWQAAAISKVLD